MAAAMAKIRIERKFGIDLIGNTLKIVAKVKGLPSPHGVAKSNRPEEKLSRSQRRKSHLAAIANYDMPLKNGRFNQVII